MLNKRILFVLLVIEAQQSHILNFPQYPLSRHSPDPKCFCFWSFLWHCLCSNFDFLYLIPNYFYRYLQFLTIQVHFRKCSQRCLFILLLKRSCHTRPTLSLHSGWNEIHSSPIVLRFFSFLLQLSIIALIWNLFPFFVNLGVLYHACCPEVSSPHVCILKFICFCYFTVIHTWKYPTFLNSEFTFPFSVYPW